MTEQNKIMPTYGNELTLSTYRENAKELFKKYLSFYQHECDSRGKNIYYYMEKGYEYIQGQFKTVKEYANFYLRYIEVKYQSKQKPVPVIHFTDDMTMEDINKTCGPIYNKELF